MKLRSCLSATALATALTACATEDSTRVATSAPSTSRDYVERIPGTDVAFDMVWIEDGGFWIGRTEVTWDEYLLYCAWDEDHPEDADAVSRPSKPLDVYPYDRDWGAGRRPAVGVSWNAAKLYCEWLSRQTGHAYRLPTEAEWLAACGAPGDPLDTYAWYAGNSDSKTQEVGRKAPNPRGLHDTLGNVWEYCLDPWSEDEPNRAVLRGGSWKDDEETVGPSHRLRFDDDWTLDDPEFPPGVWWIPDGDHLGLRVLRPGQP